MTENIILKIIISRYDAFFNMLAGGYGILRYYGELLLFAKTEDHFESENLHIKTSVLFVQW